MNTAPSFTQFSNALSVQATPLRGEVHREFQREETLADIFHATVAAQPHKTAIIEGGTRLSYLEVDRLSDQIATALISRGVGAGDVVGLFMPRGADLLVSQIAITKTGAAWLPFDAETPADRISTCLADAQAKGLLVNDVLAPRVAQLDGVVWSISDAQFPALAQTQVHKVRDHSPDHFAYLIYTSGSTGKPKGIAITHRNICHYLRAANHVYGITSDDVMFQGCSAAFDLSMEEIWIPYLVGATLWVATPDVIADTEHLPGRLAQAGISVIDTVPTLLSMCGEDIPSLRVVIVGGEACPNGIVDRFTKNGCRLFNSYGPTEATVVATIAELKSGMPVTIGKPIPNYTAYVVDEHLKPVASGTQGELLIGGPGVASGYLGRPELTSEKFIANPFCGDTTDPVLYRSGDAVSVGADGNILFHGRIDDQIKIRGFRVELGEIEAAIADDPAVEHAAVVLRQDDGIERLVAFVMLRRNAALDVSSLREVLRKRLPPYMVPNAFEVIEAVPRLSSGKVDRKALKQIPLQITGQAEESDVARNDVEAVLIQAAKEIFPGQAIKLDADFFTEMGGHSMLAAQFISKVRQHPLGALITLQDMYSSRTLTKIGEILIERGALDAANASADTPSRAPSRRRFWCGVAQALTLPFILVLHAAPWMAIFIAYTIISPDENSLFGDLSFVFVAFMLVTLFNYMFVPLAKLAILPKTKPGVYPLWGTYFYRIWLVQRLTNLVHLKWMHGTPVLRFYLRLLGAKVGKDALISEIYAGAYDLVTIGDHAALGTQTVIANTRAVGDKYIVGPVHIGNDVVIGNSAVIEDNVTIGDGTELADLSSVVAGTTLPSYELWSGSPCKKVRDIDPGELPMPADAGKVMRFAQTAFYTTLLIALPPISILPVVPAFRVMEWFDTYVNPLMGGINYMWYLPVIAMPAAASMVFLTCLLVAAIRWIVLPRLKPGRYSVFGGTYLRKWIVTLSTDLMIDAITSITATIFMPAWYRLMGAKIGRGTEISTNFAGRYDLIELGDGNFIADEVRLGDENLSRNWMTLGPVKTGDKVFIGNSAVVPMNYNINSGALIGVKSRPPEGGEVKASETWFGSPPIKLPVRQRFSATDATTFKPSRWIVIRRALFEAFNISLPITVFITLATYGMEMLDEPISEGSWTEAITMSMLVVLAIDLCQVLIPAACKWIAMGVYRPTIQPMWSWWALRTEAVAVMFGGMAGSVIEHLNGTPMMAFALRLFGTKIGKGSFIDYHDLTEFDCVEIGDYVNINAFACLQTHLYEDRLMKVGRIRIGNDVTIGAGSTVLYDTRVGDGAIVGPLTLVMKGEELPKRSAWVGAPAQPMRNAAPAAPALVPMAA